MLEDRTLLAAAAHSHPRENAALSAYADELGMRDPLRMEYVTLSLLIESGAASPLDLLRYQELTRNNRDRWAREDVPGCDRLGVSVEFSKGFAETVRLVSHGTTTVSLPVRAVQPGGYGTPIDEGLLARFRQPEIMPLLVTAEQEWGMPVWFALPCSVVDPDEVRVFLQSCFVLAREGPWDWDDADASEEDEFVPDLHTASTPEPADFEVPDPVFWDGYVDVWQTVGRACGTSGTPALLLPTIEWVKDFYSYEADKKPLEDTLLHISSLLILIDQPVGVTPSPEDCKMWIAILNDLKYLPCDGPVRRLPGYSDSGLFRYLADEYLTFGLSAVLPLLQLERCMRDVPALQLATLIAHISREERDESLEPLLTLRDRFVEEGLTFDSVPKLTLALHRVRNEQPTPRTIATFGDEILECADLVLNHRGNSEPDEVFQAISVICPHIIGSSVNSAALRAIVTALCELDFRLVSTDPDAKLIDMVIETFNCDTRCETVAEVLGLLEAI